MIIMTVIFSAALILSSIIHGGNLESGLRNFGRDIFKSKEKESGEANKENFVKKQLGRFFNFFKRK